jgi:hypothetical protein
MVTGRGGAPAGGTAVEGIEMTPQPGLTLLHSGIPARARKLIWDVFFQSRGRGVTFEEHLPWSASADTLCVAIDSETDAMADAALIIRPSPLPGTGMIGFVAVREAVRGRALSGVLLKAAIASAVGRYRSLLLWTTKPGVYERAGFVLAGRDVALQFQMQPGLGLRDYQTRPWPARDAPVALPAFASAGGTAIYEGASLVYALSGEAATVMDWTGSPDIVTRLIASVRPGKWHMSVGSDDPLEQALSRLPVALSRRPGALTMVRDLEGNGAGELARIPPLERI